MEELGKEHPISPEMVRPSQWTQPNSCCIRWHLLGKSPDFWLLNHLAAVHSGENIFIDDDAEVYQPAQLIIFRAAGSMPDLGLVVSLQKMK